MHTENSSCFLCIICVSEKIFHSRWCLSINDGCYGHQAKQGDYSPCPGHRDGVALRGHSETRLWELWGLVVAGETDLGWARGSGPQGRSDRHRVW